MSDSCPSRPLSCKRNNGDHRRGRLEWIGKGPGKAGLLPSAGRIRLILAAALLSIGGPNAARAIVTSDGEGTHVVTPGVPAFGVNLDGVAYIGAEALFGIGGGSGALISDTHVLTAAHVAALGPFLLSVRFELADGPVWIPVKGYAIHPDYDPVSLNRDVAVLELASPAPAGIPRYELHSTNDEIGKTFVVAGYGTTGSGATGATFIDRNKRAGLNRYETTGASLNALFNANIFTPTALYFDFDSGLAANDSTPLVTGFPDPGFGDDEVGVAPGDSGGPAFIEGGDGIFRIAGVTSFGQKVDYPDGMDRDFLEGYNASWGEIMGSERVSESLDFINGAMAGNLIRQRIFYDGLTHVIDDGLDGGPVFVGNSPAPDDAATTVTLENAVIRDLAGGLSVNGSSLVKMEAGLIEGAPAARVEDGGRLHVAGGTLNALPNYSGGFGDNRWAIFATDSSEVRLSGGTLTGFNAGIFAVDDSQVFITAGTVTGEARALHIGSMAEIDGGSFSSAGDALQAVGGASLTVRGGTFHGDVRGGVSVNTTTVVISNGAFTGGVVGFQSSEASDVEIGGGSFSAPYAFFANGQSKVRVSAGTFTGTTEALQSTDTSVVLIEDGRFEGDVFALSAQGSSEMVIRRGTFDGGSFDLSADDSARVRIHGYGFNFPLGPVSPGEGVITGFYDDGTPFATSFLRRGGGVVELIDSRLGPRGSGSLKLSRVSRFVPTQIGNRSRTQVLRVSNDGSQPVKKIRVQTAGRGKRDFVVTRPATRVLEPGESTVIRITFRPRAPGDRKAEARVFSSERPASRLLRGRSYRGSVPRLPAQM